jgi:hypothetical protein
MQPLTADERRLLDLSQPANQVVHLAQRLADAYQLA